MQCMCHALSLYDKGHNIAPTNEHECKEILYHLDNFFIITSSTDLREKIIYMLKRT
jgi:hypothetical protein